VDQNKKEYIINNLKWPINHFEYFSHYFISIIPISLIYIGIAEYRKEEDILPLVSTGITLLLFIIYRIETERKFRELIITKDLSTIEIGKILEKNGWILRNWHDATLELTTNKNNLYQGERVTIIKVTKDKILINTQPSGNRASFTIFKEKINYREIKRILEN
jgi:hypothetical protein